MTFLEKFRQEFSNSGLLRQAFTHRSYHNENPTKSKGHNERLEFLGDAVIDLVLSDYLMKRFPEMNEGNLSKIRASLVNEASLAAIALEMGFDLELRLGRGEAMTGGAKKPRLLASSFEAFVGCLYREQGYQDSYNFLETLFKERIDHMDMSISYETDYKTRLQELVQDKSKKTPSYFVVNEEGPDHDKTFFVEVRLANDILAVGRGKSKKQAEQESAHLALKGLQL